MTAPEIDVKHKIRTVRARAKRLGFRLVVRGESMSVWDKEQVVRLGDIDTVGVWIADQVIPHYRAPGPQPEAPPASWAPWLDLFVDELTAARRSPDTIAKRTEHLVTFARAHPRTSPLSASRDQLIAWLGTPHWQPRTAHGVRSSLRVFFRFMHEREHRRDNPAATLPTISLPRSLPRPCPDAVVREAAAGATTAVRLALRILVETGMRRAEVARLRPADVEGQCGKFQVRVVGKGGHVRVIPISDDLAARLLAVPTNHVFPAYGGAGSGPITPRHLGTQITRALPDSWTTHTLRHRFATAAYVASGDIRAVQDLLGHASPAATAIYTKVADEAMRKAAAAAYMEF